MNENEAKLIIRAHGVAIDIMERDTYVDIVRRLKLIPQPEEVLIEHNQETTVEYSKHE